jgi:hypothetical protein
MASWGVDVVHVRVFLQTAETKLDEVGMRGESTCVAILLSG